MGKRKQPRAPAATLPLGLSQAFLHALGLTRPFEAVVFRIVASRYASREDLWTGAGARQHGGRWNPPGTFHTVYASPDIQTATAKYFGNYQLFGLETATDKTPYLTAAAWVRLRASLDMTDQAVLRALGVSSEALLAGGWQNAGAERLTQTLGRWAYEARIEGLIVPSAARIGGTNTVVFPWNLHPPDSYLRLLNPDELPGPRVDDSR